MSAHVALFGAAPDTGNMGVSALFHSTVSGLCEVVNRSGRLLCGTRVHAIIAALSSATRSASVSYSDKAIGVFETCGQGEHVVDPRQLDTYELVERLKRSFADREHAKASLAKFLPDVKHAASEQLKAIAARIMASVKYRERATR